MATPSTLIASGNGGGSLLACDSQRVNSLFSVYCQVHLCARFAFVKMAAKWDSETTIKFIQEYKLHECLWNCKSPTYKNKQMRDAAYGKIVQIMDLPGFGVPEVKLKIRNIRSTYCQEKKKIANSKRSGSGSDTVYIKWLGELDSMLKDLDQRRKAFDNVSIFL